MKRDILEEAWKEVLEVGEVGDDDHFFELGGDSIKAVQLVARLLQKGLKLDILAIYSTPEFANLLEALEETDPVAVPESLLTEESIVSLMSDPEAQAAALEELQNSGLATDFQDGDI